MTVSLQDIQNALSSLPANETEWLNLALAFLSTPQFGSMPVTNWQDGSPFKALLQNEAYCLADMNSPLSSTMLNVVQGGILDLAEGVWLDFWGQGLFQEKRLPVIQEVQFGSLTNSTSSDITFAAGELIVGTSTGQEYTPVADTGNLDEFGNHIFTPTGITVIANSGTLVFIQALINTPGSTGNAANFTIVNIVSPPTLGLVVTNSNPFSYVFNTVLGRDVELDDAYKTRLKSKWPSNSFLRAGVLNSYDYWIHQASPDIINYGLKENWNPYTNTIEGGSISIWINPPTSVNDVGTWFDDSISPHRPLCTTVYVRPANSQIITLLGNINTSSTQSGSIDINSIGSSIYNKLKTLSYSTKLGSTINYSVVLSSIQSIQGIDHIDSFTINGSFNDIQLSLNSFALFVFEDLLIDYLYSVSDSGFTIAP
jgi:hypothetical protein